MSSSPTPEARRAMAARYDALWEAAMPVVRGGRAALDPWATRKGEDGRRGLTLLARPAPAVADALAAFAAELRALEPAQYYQPRADLHLTTLSLFTAVVDYAPHLAHLDAYRAAVAEAVAGAAPFAVEHAGVTVSTGAVLVQGFPCDGGLERLRDRLRAALTTRGLGALLDRRYRLETAHMTLVRYTTPLARPDRFVDALTAARGRGFGVTQVGELELVLGDWYQSAQRSRLVATDSLSPGRPDDV